MTIDRDICRGVHHYADSTVENDTQSTFGAGVQAENKALKSAKRKILQRWRKTVGAVIGSSIRDSDRKQFQVARTVGMSADMLSDIVQGHRRTELGEIVLIAKALNEDPLVLIRRMLHWYS